MPRVLWAEDNPQDQSLIRIALEELAHPPEVRFVDDGVFLLAELERGRPDLVVLDLRMPRVGGLEALQAIRANPAWRKLRVAVFSAGNQPDEIALCRSLGAAVILQKPVNYDQFSLAVAELAVLATAPDATQAF